MTVNLKKYSKLANTINSKVPIFIQSSSSYCQNLDFLVRLLNSKSSLERPVSEAGEGQRAHCFFSHPTQDVSEGSCLLHQVGKFRWAWAEHLDKCCSSPKAVIWKCLSNGLLLLVLVSSCCKWTKCGIKLVIKLAAIFCFLKKTILNLFDLLHC